MPHSKVLSHDIAPAAALQQLKEGNFRFINNLSRNRDLLELVNKTKDGQWPFAAVLSCMDSRTSAELIFDQSLGDIFSIRIAGNVIMDEVLGSLEYATAVAGSRLIVVLGHTNCGAIKGACDHVEMGHLTALLDRIQPAVNMEQTITENRNSSNAEFVEAVSKLNVKHSVQQILDKSQVIRSLVMEGNLGIAPAMYDVATGKVMFYEKEARLQPADLGQPAAKEVV
jgi:carbonic anhydrase